MPFIWQILLASYQIYASLKHLCRVYRAFFLINLHWYDRCEFEAWLNFSRVASRSLFLELFIEILSKELI
ncbi:hypothetical protein [Campylobacter concisus]|uniref:hypothetical protein n=1 Tax=Campylobacter concisus TaxID=199 RepID=UPI003D200D22